MYQWKMPEIRWWKLISCLLDELFIELAASANFQLLMLHKSICAAAVSRSNECSSWSHTELKDRCWAKQASFTMSLLDCETFLKAVFSPLKLSDCPGCKKAKSRKDLFSTLFFVVIIIIFFYFNFFPVVLQYFVTQSQKVFVEGG